MLGKVVVLGANGQLGSDLCKVFRSCEVVGLTHEDLEITDKRRVRRTLEMQKPDVVINTVAYHNVPECERNVGWSYAVNAEAVGFIAEVCESVGARLVFISTDYVFDGEEGPYDERGQPKPLNVYGRSKFCGEMLALAANCKSLVARTSALFGLTGCRAKSGKNFIEVILEKVRLDNVAEIDVVVDQMVSPSFTLDVARRVKELVEAGASGIFHVTNSGWCTWYEFARAIVEFLPDVASGIRKVTINPVKTSDGALKRPKNSSLVSTRCLELGLPPLRGWREALEHYLQLKGIIGGSRG